MEHKKFAVIGGDARQCHIAELIKKSGFEVVTSALDQAPLIPEIPKLPLAAALADANIIILPLPVSRDNITLRCDYSYEAVYISDIFSHAAPGAFIAAGKISNKLIEAAAARNLRVFDYLQREELNVLNSIPTAEGAIQTAMQNTPYTIFGSKILVSGYGRIGKILAANLRDLGALVTVSARKYSDFAWIETNRMNFINSDELSESIHKYNLIFNTVPALLFDEKIISRMNPECLLIDLASAPGGIDFEAAGALNIKAVQALSLPGKVAPKSAAKIIFTAINNIIAENE